MPGTSLDPNAYIGDLEGWVLVLLRTNLAIDNSWEKLAESCSGVYSVESIRQFKASTSPVSSFIDDIISKHMTLKYLKYVLRKAGLLDILSSLQEPQRVEIKGQSHTGDVLVPFKSDVTIGVDACGIPPPSYQWFKYQDALQNENESQLTIENFGIDDDDTYWCRVFHVFDGEVVSLWSQPFSLHVEDTPPSFQKDLGHLNLIEGDEMTLQCLASGFPALSYKWFKNSELLQTFHRNSLTVSNVSLSDAGAYRCIVKNGAGKCESSIANVNVIPKSAIPSSLKIVQHPMLYRDDLSIGHLIILECRAHSLQNVHFTWFVSGQPLEEEHTHYYHIMNFAISPHEYGSHLSYTIPNNAESFLRIGCEAASPDERKMSKEVSLNVGPSGGLRNTEAGHKLALLIAMSKYDLDSMTNLSTPPSDIALIAKELSALDFRCFSFIDLNHIELLNAFKFFSTLIRPGDYVIFYYGGHGYFNGVNQLLPVPQDNALINLPMPNVMEILQENEPSLLFVILDMCKHPHFTGGGLEEIAKISTKRNCIILHATSVGYQSLEEKTKSSVLTTALVRHLQDPVDVVSMALGVCDDIQNSIPYVRNEQIPSCEINLCGKPKLSDPISRIDVGRFSYWASLFQLPQRKTQAKNLGTMQVIVTVECQYPDTEKLPMNSMLVIFRLQFLGELAEKPKVSFLFNKHREYIFDISESNGMHIFKVDALQRLKESLKIIVELGFPFLPDEKQSFFFDLKLPGVAKVALWAPEFALPKYPVNLSHNI